MKSILDIDVHDEKFKRFVESFKEYQTSTERLNEVWKHFEVLTKKPRAATEALNKAINQARKSSDAMGKTWAQIGKHIGDSDRKLSHFGRTIHGVERGLAKVARIGLSLGKFALAAGGIGMIGGLFGLDALANSAMQRQKSARGLGMPIWQVSAFKTYMEPYLNSPSGTLASIINARQTPQGQAALISLGFTPEQYRHPKNRMAFAEQVLQSIGELYARHKAEGNEQLVFQARGIQNLGVSLSEGRGVAKALATGNFQKSIAQSAASKSEFNLPWKTATAWTNLKVQLQAAGIAIETALIKAFAPLAPQIATLSKKIVSFIGDFANSKEIKQFISSIGGGLKSFTSDLEAAAKFMAGKKFQTDMAALGDSAILAARALLGVAKVIGSPAIKLLVHGVEGAFSLNRKLEHLYNEGGEMLFGKKKYDQAHNKLLGMLGLGPTGSFYTNRHEWREHNNPGNIEAVRNGVHGYAAYPSMAAGYFAIGRRLLGYSGPHTVSNLVSTYEGHNAPHLAEHIAKIAQWMHVGRNQKLNLGNTGTLAHLVTGLAEFEHPHRQSMTQLYNTIRDAIVDGMKSVTIHAHSSAGSRIFTAAHAASH